MPQDTISAYDQMAQTYASDVHENPENAYIEQPAMLDLLPAVEGKRVLDAGCGPGTYTETLLDRGADVVGVDASEELLSIARDRVGDRAEFRQLDLRDGLDQFDTNAFDLVCSSLVLHYIADWKSLFEDFRRVIRPGGHLCFSVGNPVHSVDLFEDFDYHEVTERIAHWTVDGEDLSFPTYPRSFEAQTHPLLENDFVIEKIVEPEPLDACEVEYPEKYERYSAEPFCICYRASLPA
jgi:SAM-dependent methyltransferase